MNISEFRKQYPQYDNVDDDTLTQKLHAKFYSDTPFETFSARFRGITPEQARQELRRREAAAELQRRGVAPNTGGQRKPDIVDKVFGPKKTNVIDKVFGSDTDGAAAMERIHRDLDAKYGTPSHPIGGVAPQRRGSNEVIPDDTVGLTRAMGPVGGTAFALSSALREPAPKPKPKTFTPDPSKQYFMPAPKRKFFENFLPTRTPELPPWEGATTREKAEKILKPAAGMVANTLWRALAFAARPAYAAYKRARPQDIPEEMKDMTLDEAVAHLSGRDPSGLEKLMGGVMEFVGPTKLAGSILGQAPKAAGLLGGAIKTAETWGAGEAVNQLGKRMAQEIDPSKANYNYEGMIAVVKTAATALPIGAITTTELAPIVKTALESSVFGGLTAAEGGTPEEIVTAFAIPLGLKGKAGLRWRREIAAEAVGRVRDEIITRNKGDEATIKDVTAKADKTIEDIKAGKLDVREPDEATPTPGKPEYLKSEWKMKREFAPGEQVEPLQEAYRSILINKHIALYQAFEASEPGSARWKQLQDKIYAMTTAINDIDGIADPAEGRQFVPVEYARAKAAPKQIFRVRGDLGYPAGTTARPEAPVVGETPVKRVIRKTGQEVVPVTDAALTTAEAQPALSAQVPAKRVIRKPEVVPVAAQTQVVSQGPVVAEAKPKTRRGLELSILKTADKAKLTKDQYHDALEKAVGKRSIKDLSIDELNTASEYFRQNYETAPTEKDVLVVVDEQTVKMRDVINEAVQSVANLKPQKRVLRRRVPIGSARGIWAGLRKAGRFFFGEFNAGPYYLAKVLDGGNEKGIFSRIFDRNIQIGNSLRSQNIFTLNRLSQETRKAAGTTADDLAVMSRAVNPRFKAQERIRAWQKTKVIPIKIGDGTWDFTMGRLLNFYGQTSQVDPTTGEPIGREYARRFGIRLENQFTGPMSDAEIDYLRSLVESDPKAMAEMDIEWKVVGPTRAKFVNETSQRVEGRDIATIPNWYHLEISKSQRVPGKTIRVETKDKEAQSLESLIEEGTSNLKIDLIENQSIFEPRRGGGRGPLVVRDHFEVVNAVNHATAAYYGFAQPFRIARTVLNDPDIQGGLDAKGYRDTRELLTKLFSRLQGSERGAGGELGPFKKMRAGFYRAVINFSPHVILPQPTSVLNYGAYADAKYVAVAVGGMFNPTTAKEMLYTSPVAQERFHGGFSTMELGETMESDAVLQAMTNRNAYIDRPSIMMRVMDIVPLNGGWALAKAEIRDAAAGTMNPKGLSARWWGDKDLTGLDENSAKWEQLLTDRAEYLWQRTQQTWDPTNRSWFTSHPNQVVRSLWFFRTYHEKIVAMWNDALFDYKNGRSTAPEFAKRVSYPIASYMAEATMRAILLAAIFGDVKDPDDYGLALITSPLSAFPLIGTLMQGAIISFAKAAEGKKQRRQNFDTINSPLFDMTNEITAAIAPLSQGIGELVAGDEEKAKKTIGQALYRLIRPVGMSAGIPVHNIQKGIRRFIPKEEPTGGRVIRKEVIKKKIIWREAP